MNVGKSLSHVLCVAPSAAPRTYSPHYLAVMEDKCLNCLSSSHRRVNYCLPTRCRNYHGFRHHLRDCRRTHKSSIALEVFEVVLQAPRDTLPSLGDEGTPTPSAANRFPEPDLVFLVASVCFISRSWNPMIEEATLGIIIVALGHSCQEEIAVMVEQLDSPPPIAMSPCLSKPLPPVNIQTPEIFRN
jgi:hypothetical protein